MAVAVPSASQIGPLTSDGGNAFASTCGAGQPEDSERPLRSRPPKTRPLEHLLAGRSHVLGAPPRCFTGGAERRRGLTGYQWLTEQNRMSPAVAANRSLQVVASKEQPAGSTGEYHKYPKQLGVGGASQLAAGMGKGVFRFRVNQLTGRNGRKSLAVVANRKG